MVLPKPQEMMSFSQTPVSVSLTVKNRRFLNLFTHTPASYITISVEVEGIQGPQRIPTGLNLFCLAACPPPFSISLSIEVLPQTSLTYTYFYVSHQERTQDKILSTECANWFSHLKVKFYRGQDPKCQPNLPGPTTAKSTALLTRALMEKIFLVHYPGVSPKQNLSKIKLLSSSWVK